MRILGHALRRVGNAHEIKDFQTAAPGLGIGHVLMDAQRLDELGAHAQVRRQRRQRVLEDHGDVRTPQTVQRVFSEGENFLSLKNYRPGGTPVGSEQPERGEEKLALTRT